MCLALPAQVIELGDDDEALVEVSGVRQTISLALVDGVVPGDYVIVHVGYAIARLDTDEAERTLALLAEVAATGARTA